MTRRLLIAVLVLGLCGASVWAMAGGEPPSKKKGAKSAYTLPKKMKREWPPGEVASAKAYTFNFDTNLGPGLDLYVYRNDSWHKTIRSTHELSEDATKQALDLVHVLGGTTIVPKCPLPRHGVGFCDKDDKPLGSVNMCFECGDIMVWPPYYDDSELEEDRWSISKGDGPLLLKIHEQTMPK